VPVEIEEPSEIGGFTKFEILDEYGRTYKSGSNSVIFIE
jgi:hypothetical protein